MGLCPRLDIFSRGHYSIWLQAGYDNCTCLYYCYQRNEDQFFYGIKETENLSNFGRLDWYLSDIQTLSVEAGIASQDQFGTAIGFSEPLHLVMQMQNVDKAELKGIEASKPQINRFEIALPEGLFAVKNKKLWIDEPALKDFLAKFTAK